MFVPAPATEFHTKTSPLLLRHSMSACPSPLKSPTPWICHVEAIAPKSWKVKLTDPAPGTEFHSRTSPLVLRHKMSVLPSLLKSPTPWICQLVGVTPKSWL